MLFQDYQFQIIHQQKIKKWINQVVVLVIMQRFL